MGFFDSSSSSTNNNTQNYDQRQVNTMTDSNNTFVDGSRTDTWSDSNNTFVDNSVRNTLDGGAINMAGAVVVSALGNAGDLASAAIRGAGAQTQQGYDYADTIFSSVTKYANGVNNHMADAYSQAAEMQNDALIGARAAYQSAGASIVDGFKTALDATRLAMGDSTAAAQSAQGATAAAYADAKGTTNSQKQIIIGVLVVAGIMALAMMQKKEG